MATDLDSVLKTWDWAYATGILPGGEYQELQRMEVGNVLIHLKAYKALLTRPKESITLTQIRSIAATQGYDLAVAGAPGWILDLWMAPDHVNAFGNRALIRALCDQAALELISTFDEPWGRVRCVLAIKGASSNSLIQVSVLPRTLKGE